MARLRFDADKVRRLIEHAKASTLHTASYEQAYEILGDEWADGKVSAESIRDRVPAALHFVHDDGLYLMSNGYPTLPGSEFGQASVSGVVYAEGYDPRHGDVWDKCRDAVGGDDFVESIDIATLPAMPANAQFLVIDVSAKRLAVGWASRKARVN